MEAFDSFQFCHNTHFSRSRLSLEKLEEEMEELVRVPKDLKGFVIGAKGSIIKSIQERSGARVYSLSRDEEGFRVSGTREERDLAKKLILEKVVS